MKSNHRLLFVMYLGAGILSLALFLAIPLFHIERSNWMNVMFPLLTIIWFANAFIHWKRMKRIHVE
ncbi:MULTISPECIES: hypothetical protein [Exiguobacterium]|jgi:hypothetical protein|uniref:hypothetical protein n=1 Tax=Exiguobacterium TaxID=33986 RepID=UPI001CD7981B|nr:hypothetical protein [Exiguobacterium aestuarii]MCA0982203.1 hypothetical protein [Exiguobacterium aestuarii]